MGKLGCSFCSHYHIHAISCERGACNPHYNFTCKFNTHGKHIINKFRNIDTPTVYGEKTKEVDIKMGKRKTFRSVEAARAYAKKTGGEVINNPKGFTDKRVGHLAVRKKK